MEITKKKRIILLICACVLTALIVAISLFCQSAFDYTGAKEPASIYNDTLKKAFEENPNFGNTPITKIAMLGSHDALSYGINRNSPSNTSEDTITNNKLINFAGRGAIARYSKAQKHDIYTQLNCGVRYIDARITNIDGVFYTSHGLVSHTLGKSLEQILMFLHENPGEFIYFHIQHFYKGNSNWSELSDYIASVKYQDKCLYDYVNYDTDSVQKQSQITYNMMTENATKAGVLFIANCKDSESSYSRYFKLKDIDSHWHDIANSKALKNAVIKYFDELPQDIDCLRVNQAQTTPNSKGISDTLIGWSLLDMAKKHNINMLNSPDFEKWLEKMPIYMCDYTTSTYNDFNNKVNKIISDYNKKL